MIEGHAMLHTLYGQSLKEGVRFFVEYFAMDLMMVEGKCVGVVSLNMEDGTCHRMFARNTVLATGGECDYLIWPNDFANKIWRYA